MAVKASARRRREVIDALRHGTVPQQGLALFAVGLGPFEGAVDDEMRTVKDGGAQFKAVRGEYGAGKTFFSRWLTERAKAKGFATAEIQISETETPLYKLETVYRRVIESLATRSAPSGAFRDVVDGWFHVLSEDAKQQGVQGTAAVDRAAGELLEKRLLAVSREAPSFSQALRGYRRAVVEGDRAGADSLLAWLGGQPHVAASAKRAAGVKGNLDHFGALGFLQGLLTVLRDSEYSGLVLVLDEVETLQRMRRDVQEKSLNALRQLLDEIDGGRFPGLYLVMTGTPAFYDGQMGVQRLAPLAQRLETDFQTDPRFDNPRAVQIRLRGFALDSLVELGGRIRDLYADDGKVDSDRIHTLVDDAYIADLARAVAGQLGGKVGVAPRVFLKKLVDVLDRVDQHEGFDPRRAYQLTVATAELSDAEREASALGRPQAASRVDDIDLAL